jgi:hypothetical protein
MIGSPAAGGTSSPCQPPAAAGIHLEESDLTNAEATLHAGEAIAAEERKKRQEEATPVSAERASAEDPECTDATS